MTQQAAEKDPSASLTRSRGAATYGLSTPRTSHRVPPCIWTFLSSLRKSEPFSILLGCRPAQIPPFPPLPKGGEGGISD